MMGWLWLKPSSNTSMTGQGPKTLFATHYHELTDLEQTLSRLRNVHVATLEKDGQVTFLHRIEEGPADKSYGIHVAKIAGLPSDLLSGADTILSQLEGQKPRSADGDSNTRILSRAWRTVISVCSRCHSSSTRRIKNSRYLQHDPRWKS